MYQFVIIVVALLTVRDEGKLDRYKARIAILHVISIIWVALNINGRLPEVVGLQNALRDVGLSDGDFKELVSYVTVFQYFLLVSAIWNAFHIRLPSMCICEPA